MERELKQQEALDSLYKAYLEFKEIGKPQRIIFKAVMRFGKTKVLLEFLNLLENPNLTNKILIVVPRKKNVESWLNEIKLWNINVKVDIKLYTSLHKLDYTPSLIIFDEFQRLTVNKYDLIKYHMENCPFMIAASGTLPRDKNKREIFENLGFIQKFNITLKEAIDLKIVNNFKIKVIYSDLDFNKNIHVKTGKWDFKTSEFLSYKSICKKIAINTNKKLLINRANYIYGLKSKINPVKKLIEIINNNEKIIIFTKRVEIAKELSTNNVFNGNAENDKNLTDFINNDIRILSCVEMLNEGITIPGIDSVIIQQLDSNPNNFLQRIGRSLLFEENKTVKVFIIIAKNTIEEEWLQKAIPKDVEIDYYYYNNLTKLVTRIDK